MSMAKSDPDLQSKILSEAGDHRPYDCFQCMQCTSGCPSMKMLELMPHFIAHMISLGLVNEIVSSGITWTCMHCLKCKERCPQKVAPVDLIFALRNLAVDMEAEIPEGVLKRCSLRR